MTSEPATVVASLGSSRARPKAGARRRLAEADTGADGSVAAEVAILRRVSAALRSGDPKGALAAVGEHARRFPNGALSEERDMERILALCALSAGATTRRAPRSGSTARTPPPRTSRRSERPAPPPRPRPVWRREKARCKLRRAAARASRLVDRGLGRGRALRLPEQQLVIIGIEADGGSTPLSVSVFTPTPAPWTRSTRPWRRRARSAMRASSMPTGDPVFRTPDALPGASASTSSSRPGWPPARSCRGAARCPATAAPPPPGSKTLPKTNRATPLSPPTRTPATRRRDPTAARMTRRERD